MPDDANGQLPEFMVFGVGECLRRGDDYAFACMDTQGVEIFHVADGDAIVVTVAYYLVFNFFPAFQTFFNQNLIGEGKSLFCQLIEFFFVFAKSRA